MGDRWDVEARRLATLDRSIESIKTALRAAYEAGRADQLEADAKACEAEPENFVGDLLFLDQYEDACQCCAAAIRAQDPRRELAQASWVRLEQLLEECRQALRELKPRPTGLRWRYNAPSSNAAVVVWDIADAPGEDGVLGWIENHVGRSAAAFMIGEDDECCRGSLAQCAEALKTCAMALHEKAHQ